MNPCGSYWHEPPTAWIMCPATTLKPLRNTLRNTTKSPFATLQTLHIPTWPSIWEIHRKKTWSTVAPSRDPKDRLSTSRCQTPRAQTGQSCFGGPGRRTISGRWFQCRRWSVRVNRQISCFWNITSCKYMIISDNRGRNGGREGEKYTRKTRKANRLFRRSCKNILISG